MGCRIPAGEREASPPELRDRRGWWRCSRDRWDSRSRPNPVQSVQPVFHAKSRYALEIPLVGGEENGILGQCNRCDFQVHRPESKMLTAEVVKLLGSGLV